MRIDWKELLTTPYPRTGWGLGGGQVVVLDEDRKHGTRCARAPLPEKAVEIGPVGLQSVDGEALAALFASLQQEAGGCRRPSVVVPNSWVRVHLLDFDEVPRRPAELEEVVRWRLKKLLPIRPGELRIDAQAEKAPGGGWRVLSVSGVARAWEDLESAFWAAGMQPAFLTPSVFALGELVPPSMDPVMLVQSEPGMLAVVVRTGGTIGLVNTRLLPPAGDAAEAVGRELRTIRLFLGDRLGIEGEVPVLAMAMDEEQAADLRRGCEAVDGISPMPPLQPPACQGWDGSSGSLLTVVASVAGRRPV